MGKEIGKTRRNVIKIFEDVNSKTEIQLNLKTAIFCTSLFIVLQKDLKAP